MKVLASKQKMSLWPSDYDRLYAYRCPLDLTAVLDAAACAPPPPEPACPTTLPCTCASTGYQRAPVFKGSRANGLSALNRSRMLNSILAAKAGAALCVPCAPAGPSVAEARRRARAAALAPFVPSLVMYRV